MHVEIEETSTICVVDHATTALVWTDTLDPMDRIVDARPRQQTRADLVDVPHHLVKVGKIKFLPRQIAEYLRVCRRLY